jgi:MFS transporter, ACS family, tartrate transporter
VAKFMAANALASIFMNPLSGLIMKHMHGAAGWKGWQWVFLLESIPSLILGVCVYWLLTDYPAEASWLDDDERHWLVNRLQHEEQQRAERHGTDFWGAFKSYRVWYLILLYFTIAFCANAGGLYLRDLVQFHYPALDSFQIGLLAAIPSLCGAIGMLVNGHLADRTRRYWLHVGIPALISSAGWLLTAFAPSPTWAILGLSLAFLGINSMLPAFWSLPASFLSGAAAAGGIALINSVGNIGGWLGPWSLGLLKDKTQMLSPGMVVLAGVLLLGTALALFAPYDRK